MYQNQDCKNKNARQDRRHAAEYIGQQRQLAIP